MAAGTSAHEAGFAFDVPLKYMLEHPEVEQIFNKNGFGRHVAGDDIHFEWDNWQNLARGARTAESDPKRRHFLQELHPRALAVRQGKDLLCETLEPCAV